MDKILRTITSDGSLMAAAIDSSEIVYTAQKVHGLSRTACAALGRLLTGASLMGDMLKTDGATLTLKVNGSGRFGHVGCNFRQQRQCPGLCATIRKWIFL